MLLVDLPAKYVRYSEMSKVVSGMLTLGGWWGMEWWENVRVQNWSRAPKTSLEGLCWFLNGWSIAKSTLWMLGLLKKAATPAQAVVSARNCHLSLSHHHETTPVRISLEWVDYRAWNYIIVQWHSNLLVVLVWFHLTCDLVLYLVTIIIMLQKGKTTSSYTVIYRVIVIKTWLVAYTCRY